MTAALLAGLLAVAPAQAGQLEAEMLAIHNRERAAWGVAPLGWDERLARQAEAHARRLAADGRLIHSQRAERPGQGENLAMGTRGRYGAAALAKAWIAERRWFVPGRFPAVSRTGGWASVGHLTQIIWPATTRLGCGVASGRRMTVLVCRYTPPGNRDGVRVPR